MTSPVITPAEPIRFTVTPRQAPTTPVKASPGKTVVLVPSPGIPGGDGDDGTDGESAYELAVSNGFEGSEVEWLASLKGQAGKDGQNGKDGASGTVTPFVLLSPPWNNSGGNGLDRRMVATSVADGTLGGVYFAGASPWSKVDVSLAWLSALGALPAGVWRARVYLGSAVSGQSSSSTLLGSGYSNIDVPVGGGVYYETPIASGVSLDPNSLAFGAIARYGADAADTYTGAVFVVGVILRPTQ